ncbi:MAG: hypothetical protein ACRC2T_18485 [Thermoguttaceae bacterium]
MKKNILLVLICAVAVTFTAAGCGSKKLKGLVPAEGVVFLDDAPLEGATVTFAPVTLTNESRSASAKTDAAGKFKMTTLEPDDGVYPGEYLVTVVKKEANGPVPTQEDYLAAQNQGRSIIVEYIDVVPSIYANAQTSGLSANITNKGDKKLEFKLTAE